MKVIFMGTPDFSVPTIDAIVDAGHEVVAVYCQPPRPAGRGKQDRKTPVHQRADALGLSVRHPASLKSADQQSALADLKADIAVVVAYGLILPQAVLDAPKLGCLNIHASLLPRWRGAAPIHRAVMAGDKETGICIMQMDAGLDTGPVLLHEAVPIGSEDTTGDLHDRLADLGARLIVRVLSDPGGFKPVAQSDDGVTYASKIDKAEARLDFTQSARDVGRKIRGLSPFPGAWCEMSGERVKFLRSRVVSGSGNPGEHLGDFHIACGDGAVQILQAQRSGKRATTGEEFIRGATMPDRFD